MAPNATSAGCPETTLIETELLDGVAVIALNRPEKRNAINDAMRANLIQVLDWADRSADVRAIIITGRGKGFCAGGDIAAMKERLSAPAGRVGINGWQRQRRTRHLLTMLHDIPKPTIAAVNGAAAGLGCDLALCCDFVIGASDATFVMSYVLRGLIPDGGGMYFLPRRVGMARAKELIFSGRMLSADEALLINMIEQIAEPDSGDLEDAELLLMPHDELLDAVGAGRVGVMGHAGAIAMVTATKAGFPVSDCS